MYFILKFAFDIHSYFTYKNKFWYCIGVVVFRIEILTQNSFDSYSIQKSYLIYIMNLLQRTYIVIDRMFYLQFKLGNYCHQSVMGIKIEIE